MDLLQGLTATLLVLAALGGTVLFLKSRGMARFDWRRPAAVRRLQAIERLPLTPQHALHLVRLDGKLLLIASAPGGCNVLGPFEAATFGEALAKAQSDIPGAGGLQ